ncbi:MAG: putative anti-sigma regulatory factor, serine/threonine protein kinase [Anaerosporomusa subterranea]|jgi:anti-sigma regulatory factor (Ser/Thr protein kinase)|nr:putative anti-sigma regulatory factor, serine/threonine protein kinase [Anaerosporomusa subterranea]
MKYYFHCIAEFASMRPTLRNFLTEVCPQHAELLFVALNEAVNNAYDHGCISASDQGVEVEVNHSAEEIRLRVRHNGIGIKPPDVDKGLPDDDLDDHGRGLTIMRLCTDSVEYDSSGRELVMRKSLRSANRIVR